MLALNEVELFHNDLSFNHYVFQPLRSHDQRVLRINFDVLEQIHEAQRREAH